MIWTEKYKPKDLKSIKGSVETLDKLMQYDINTIPHLIIHGISGVGKRTVVSCLINHLFGISPVPKIRKTEIKNNSGSIEVSYTEADEYIEISPSEYGYQDKLIIQTIIKEMAQSKPILSLFSKSKRSSIKIIVITSAEDLSAEAQAALRRTIEVYSASFRVFLICSQLSKIIEPIRSRCLFYRLEALSVKETKDILMDIKEKENSLVTEEDIDSIVKESNGNLRRAITKLEMLNLSIKTGDKRKKMESNIKLDWEKTMDEIVGQIKRNLQPEVILEVRKTLYTLVNSCVPANFIINELYRRFIVGKSVEDTERILDLALKYEERIKTGTKGIYHIEAFIIGVMCILKGIEIKE
ncbi:Replication factor C subunit 5 [Nosema granulosis]|uniref:Replication factor C subunit 5 n=1 Tax=Nosema granulosis TaxID=83296 RepID=A0A9P6L0Q0_9MICR|nr:Replication factor C subunit 5 [Nosema granulosis]